jgi:hypothetical protein
MRVAIVDSYYLPFLQWHYAQSPDLADAPYQAQLEAMLDRQMGTGDAYSYYLREYGHEAVELVVNCPIMQRAWAREHGGRRISLGSKLPGRLGRQALLHGVLHAQLEALDPEVVYVQDLNFLTRPELDALRRSGRFVVGQIASAAPPRRVLGGYDLIVTSFPHYVERFSSVGLSTAYLAIGFDERINARLAGEGIDPSPSSERPHAVTFVGGLTPEHRRGTEMLERVAARLPLSIWGYGIETLAGDSPLRACHHGEAWGIDMYRILARSQVVLNRHIDVAEGNANNMRMFEATGVGAVLATERAPNLADLFEPVTEVLAYADEEELISRVKEQLERPDERYATARAGQARTLAEHTYRRRIEELAQLLERELAKRR